MSTIELMFMPSMTDMNFASPRVSASARALSNPLEADSIHSRTFFCIVPFGDESCLVAVSRAGEDLRIDRAPEHLSETFDLCCESLVQRTPRILTTARCTESGRQGPIRQRRLADRFTVPIEGDPYLTEPVQVSTQPKTGARTLEGLGFRRSDGMVSVCPRLSVAGLTPQAIDGHGAAYQHLACRDTLPIP
jgi:hypothetical protein